MSSDLWSFATSRYARPGVEALCLQLQQQGQDVCLLLCALWLEQHLVAADEDRLRQLKSISKPWQDEVIGPLRKLRQTWRAAAEHDPARMRWREQIKAMELEAERELLRCLEQQAATWASAQPAQVCAWIELLGNDRDTLQKLRAAVTAG